MSITVTKQVWRYSKATGNKRLVLLALADFAIEEKVLRGEPALVWPSQQTVADMCGCSRSTVELAVEWLTKAGEIVPTGNRRWGKYRGTVEYEVLPDLDLLFELTENESTDNRSSNEEEVEGEVVDLTDSQDDLTDSGELADRFTPLADRPIGHNPVVNAVVVNPVVKQGPSPSARDVLSTEEALTDYREVLADPSLTAHLRKFTKRKVAELEGELGDRELVAA